jgi:hypothetical protein
MQESKQIDAKNLSSEKLAILMSDQYEQLFQCRNNILTIYNELKARYDKIEDTSNADTPKP